MVHTPVNSSNLKSVGYENKTLEIAFKNNTVYQYFDVEINKYRELLNASSKGTYLDRYIKKGGYRYLKIK